jgi:hypothetical protein
MLKKVMYMEKNELIAVVAVLLVALAGVALLAATQSTGFAVVGMQASYPPSTQEKNPYYCVHQEIAQQLEERYFTCKYDAFRKCYSCKKQPLTSAG